MPPLPSLLSALLLASLSSAALLSPRGTRPSPRTNARSSLPPPTIVFQVDPLTALSRPAPFQAQIGQIDSAKFGQACEFDSTYTTCGDFLHLPSGITHGLFCSKTSGVCAGEGAACGSSEACGQDLTCNLSSHRCVPTGAFKLSTQAARVEERRKTASRACPELSEACSVGSGGFQCVFTLTEVEECGGCLRSGGRECGKLSNALATSCRDGTCLVHSCVDGFAPSDDGLACEESVEASDV